MKKCVKVQIDGTAMEGEVDTGCPILLIGTNTYKKIKDGQVKKPDRPLYGASGHQIDIVGVFQATVSGNGRKGVVSVYIQRQNRDLALIGTSVLDVVVPDWRDGLEINAVSLSFNIIDKIKHDFLSLIDNDFTQPIKNIQVDLTIKPGTVPVAARGRSVPYKIKDRVKAELDRMVVRGILERVENSRWASPIVVVNKPDGGIRICIDPKRTVNPYLEDDLNPVPEIDDILASIGGHEWYAVIDLSGAFQQLAMGKESRELVTIITPFGLFRYKRLPFGIKVAPAVFQSVMEKILKRCRRCRVYIDDIIVYARSAEELYALLIELLEILREYGVKINLKKCQFFSKVIRFLGHIVSSKGIFPDEGKVAEIAAARVPTNLKLLQAFLGLVTCLHKFIPHMATKLRPLYDLTRKGVRFHWDREQEAAFKAVKQELAKGKFLIHFDQHKEAVICCDASDVGIAAVLCHYEDSRLAPVKFKSRTLSSPESRYPVLHRELLAVIFGLEKFYRYVYGHRVVVMTDHQPLVGVVRRGNTLFTAYNRLQRYLIRMSPYDFELVYHPGKFNAIADFPSRFPDLTELQSPADQEEEKMTRQINAVTDSRELDYPRIVEETEKDVQMRLLKESVIKSQPFKGDIRGFSSVRDELELESGLILVNGRVVIPTVLRPAALKMLHAIHVGVVRMKQLARRYVHWPGMNKD